jgi:LCP family protein required for cell wall assembly
LVFGGVFVANLKSLSARGNAHSSSALAGALTVSAGPVSVTLPVMVSPNPSAAGAATRPAGNTSGLGSVISSVLPDWQGTDRINLLLLGADHDEGSVGHSDTIILASIDPITRSASLVSFPRDLWVDIPGCTARAGCQGGQQRINVAYAVGGAEMTMQTIIADFGLPIQHYASVDLEGFVELVDEVGGVVVDVDAPVKDDAYPTEDFGYQRIYFGPGPQLMDGAAALQYARSRHGTSDFSRAGRQQRILVSIRNRVLQLNMLSKAPELVGIVRGSLSTDLTPVQMLALGKLLSQIDRDKITNLVLDTKYVTPFKGADGADLLRPDVAAIRRAIDNAQRSADHPELRAKIEVLNGSGTAGLGQRAADYLIAQGFNIVRISAAERSDYRSTLVQVLTDNNGAAQALATTLRIPTSVIRTEPMANPTADIRIVVGQDFHLPPPG